MQDACPVSKRRWPCSGASLTIHLLAVALVFVVRSPAAHRFPIPWKRTSVIIVRIMAPPGVKWAGYLRRVASRFVEAAIIDVSSLHSSHNLGRLTRSSYSCACNSTPSTPQTMSEPGKWFVCKGKLRLSTWKVSSFSSVHLVPPGVRVTFEDSEP